MSKFKFPRPISIVIPLIFLLLAYWSAISYYETRISTRINKLDRKFRSSKYEQAEKEFKGIELSLHYLNKFDFGFSSKSKTATLHDFYTLKGILSLKNGQVDVARKCLALSLPFDKYHHFQPSWVKSDLVCRMLQESEFTSVLAYLIIFKDHVNMNNNDDRSYIYQEYLEDCIALLEKGEACGLPCVYRFDGK